MIPRNLAIAIVLLAAALLGMALYGSYLHQKALELQQGTAYSRPIAPPATGPTERVTLFVPNDENGSLVRREISATLPSDPTLRAKEILRVLIAACEEKSSKHPLGVEADVNAVFLINNNHAAIVDVNGAFADQHRSGILVEELTVASVAKTLAANMNGITEVKFLIDGRERETLAGHADLTDFYSTSMDWPID